MKQASQQQTLLQGKPWTPHGQTNVQETWKKFGWTPTNPGTMPASDLALIKEIRREPRQVEGAR